MARGPLSAAARISLHMRSTVPLPFPANHRAVAPSSRAAFLRLGLQPAALCKILAGTMDSAAWALVGRALSLAQTFPLPCQMKHALAEGPDLLRSSAGRPPPSNPIHVANLRYMFPSHCRHYAAHARMVATSHSASQCPQCPRARSFDAGWLAGWPLHCGKNRTKQLLGSTISLRPCQLPRWPETSGGGPSILLPMRQTAALHTSLDLLGLI